MHAADLHLDTPFEGVGQVDERIAARLRDASLDAFDALVELTLAREAAFLVLAGDVYDGPERGLRAQLRFEQGVRRLAAAGIRTFVTHGNHDPVLTGWQLDTAWPPEVHVFGPDEVAAVPVEREGELLAVVLGVSYAQVAETRNLAKLFRRTDADAPHVGVLHANVGGNGEHAPYAPCSVDDLRVAGMEYWALGHVHQRTVVLDGEAGGPWALYPGNLQGRSHKPSERAAKGASVVSVRGGVIGTPEHVVLDRARFVEVETVIGPDSTVGEVERALAAAGAQAVRDAAGRVVVLRARIRGVGPVSDALARDGALDELLSALRDGAGAGGDVVWTKLRDETLAAVADDGAAALLEETTVPDAELSADALATVVERRWSDALPDAEALGAAGRALAASLLRTDGS